MILDASVAVPLVIAHENAASARRLAERNDFVAPDHLMAEVANTLWRYAMRDGFSSNNIAKGLRQIRLLCTQLLPSQNLLPGAIDLAVAHRHSVYDCLYLALALERREPLATADRRLAALAEKLGIETVLIQPA